MARVRGWAEAMLVLPDDATVMVTELQCRDKGCPPLETVIAVLAPGEHWHRTIHRPAAELSEGDVHAVLADHPARR